MAKVEAKRSAQEARIYWADKREELLARHRAEINELNKLELAELDAIEEVNRG